MFCVTIPSGLLTTQFLNLVVDVDIILYPKEVKLPEPLMVKDLLNRRPFIRVNPKYPLNQILGLFWHSLEPYFAYSNFPLNILRTLASKGTPLMKQFIQQYTHSPDVNSIILVLPFQHFWCHIFTGTAHGLSSFFISPFHTPSKVTKLDIVFSVKKNVLRFEVPMEYSSL